MAEEEKPDQAPPQEGTAEAEAVEDGSNHSEGTAEAEAVEDGSNHSFAIETEDRPDWLPTGWILEIKTQKSGVNIGRPIKCYINPSTGSRFYSRKQVLRYLNAGKPFTPIKQTRSTTSSTKEICMPANEEKRIKAQALTEYRSKGLPPGWIKEIRFSNSKKGVRKITVYIDPVNRYVFSSMKDAHRYIVTGDIRACVIRPQKRSSFETDALEREICLPTSANKYDRQRAVTKRNLFSDESPGLDANMSNEIQHSPQRSSLSSPGAATADSSCSFLPHTHLKRENSKEIKLVSELSPSCYLDASSIQILDLGEKRVSKSTTKKPLNSACNKVSDPVDKTSQEFSQMKQFVLDDKGLPQVPKEMWSANMSRAKEHLEPLQGDLQASEASLLDEKKMEQNDECHSQPKKRRRNSNQGSMRTKATIKTPTRTSKRLASCKGIQITISGAVEKAHEGKADPFVEQKETPSVNLLQLDESETYNHISEESVKEQEVQEVQLGTTSNDKPICNSLADPCLEFAVKMLTSDIPVLEDRGSIEELQLGTSSNSLRL